MTIDATGPPFNFIRKHDHTKLGTTSFINDHWMLLSPLSILPEMRLWVWWLYEINYNFGNPGKKTEGFQ